MSCSASSPGFHHIKLLDIDVDELRDNFRTLRRQRSLSQSEIARLLKVSQATISSFEQGRHENIRAITLRGIHEIVSYWRREEDRGIVSNRSIVTHRDAHPEAQALCPRCGARIPSLQIPVRYCLSCGTHLIGPCECGYRSLDPEASYCSRCGKALNDLDLSELEPVVANPRQALLTSMTKLAEHGEFVSRAIRELQELDSNERDLDPRK